MLHAWQARAEERYRTRLREALRGRRVLITGASSGIGRAFALDAAAAGGDLVLVARRREELERVAGECRRRGGRAEVRPADLADIGAVRELTEALGREERAVEVLVSNAGVSLRRPLASHRPEDLERLAAVNYLGPAALTLGLLPAMLARGAGHVVHVSTIGTQTGAPLFAAYVAAKAACDHFLRTLRLELGERGIAVTAVHMPLVRTPMMAPSRIYELFPALTAERAARRIGWAVVKRPLRVAPRWATALELGHVLAPRLVQRAFAWGHEPLHGWFGRRLARRDRLRAGRDR
ncbi:MAG: SDR family NAD(P)-dependent oxidoreductase [Deltaproteobacteria bacterium]|nr:SDR family NAD(P)-dependent oxidoreductase [Deltaproteobacteria bacterium]